VKPNTSIKQVFVQSLTKTQEHGPQEAVGSNSCGIYAFLAKHGFSPSDSASAEWDSLIKSLGDACRLSERGAFI
jgi:hypothetical protein